VDPPKQGSKKFKTGDERLFTKKKTYSFFLIAALVMAVGIGTLILWPAAEHATAAQDTQQNQPLVADAGPDQPIPGPSPVIVLFDGGYSQGDVQSCAWYNQWGELRAHTCYVRFAVNFGNNDPKPGTTRTFKLVVTDSEGNTAEDEVTLTLQNPEDVPLDPLPENLSSFNGMSFTYDDGGESHLNVQMGFFTDKDGKKKWYVGNGSFGEGVFIPRVECHKGTMWYDFQGEDGVKNGEGCVGNVEDEDVLPTAMWLELWLLEKWPLATGWDIYFQDHKGLTVGNVATFTGKPGSAYNHVRSRVFTSEE
jgi:hypothetical protein